MNKTTKSLPFRLFVCTPILHEVDAVEYLEGNSILRSQCVKAYHGAYALKDILLPQTSRELGIEYLVVARETGDITCVTRTHLSKWETSISD